MRVPLPLLLFTLCPVLSSAQVSGTWQGTVKFPRRRYVWCFIFPIRAIICRQRATVLTRTFGGAPVDSVTLSGSTLTFAIPWNDGRFTGDVTSEGNIVGTFTQNRNAFPLVLTRSAGVPRTPPDTTSRVNPST